MDRHSLLSASFILGTKVIGPVVQIADTTILDAIGGAVLAALAWAFRLERKTAKTAAKQDDHEKLCADRQKDLQSDLKDIKEMLTEQNEKSVSHREAVASALASIKQDVAVMEVKIPRGHA